MRTLVAIAFALALCAGASGAAAPRGDDHEPDWAPDGKRLAFAVIGRRESAGNGLYVMNADGTARRRLVPGNVDTPDWSPTGAKLVFVGCPSGSCAGFNGVYTVRANGKGLTRLTPKTVPASGSRNPRWSPSGKLIAYDQPAGKRLPPQIYVIRADGKGRRQLTRGAGAQDPAWSPDGRRIVFAMLGTAAGIWVVNADGSGLRRLTAEPSDVDPAWSPDGSRIAFERRGIGALRDDIYTMNPDGGDVRQLTSGDCHDQEPDWSPDGTRVAFESLCPLETGESTYVYLVRNDGTGRAALALR
jgi:TolB protein